MVRTWRLPPLSGLNDSQDRRAGVRRSTARCYLKCYLNLTLLVFSRGLLHSQTRRLQAIAGLWQGHEGTERNHNPRVGGSSPSSATLQTPSEQRFPAGLVFARRTISAWCYLKCDPRTRIWRVERRGWGGETGVVPGGRRSIRDGEEEVGQEEGRHVLTHRQAGEDHREGLSGL